MKFSTMLAGTAVAALIATGALAQEQKRGTEGAQTTPQESQQKTAPERQNPQKTEQPQAPKGQAQGQQPHTQKQAEPKKTESSPRAERPAQPSEQKQATPDAKTSPGANKNADSGKSDMPKSAETPRTSGQGTADSKSGSDKNSSASNVQLSEKQRTDVHRDVLKERSVNRVNVNVQVRVGEHIGRDVRLAPLPTAVVSIVPAYRNYRYFVVDERVVIVDPARYEIVEVITPGGQVAGHAQHLTLTMQERDIIVSEIDLHSGRSTLGIGAVAEGAEVPRSVELMPFPTAVVERVSKLQGYKYFVAEQRIAIVEPTGAKIDLVIDAKR